MEAPAHQAEEWQPNTTVVVLWSVLGSTLSILSIYSSVVVYVLAHGRKAGGEAGLPILATIAVFFALLGCTSGSTVWR